MADFNCCAVPVVALYSSSRTERRSSHVDSCVEGDRAGVLSGQGRIGRMNEYEITRKMTQGGQGATW